uniref:Si:dkey-185p13.1 n=1 Tax=Xiphophorus maculatus TaxID=8083 RepID=A0A3B5PPQ7_XIPMA
MSNNNNNNNTTIAIAQKASQEDQAGNYEEAIQSYQHAVKYFLHILKREPQGKDGNQKIRDTCKQYLDRVEHLQEYLDNKEVITLHFISCGHYCLR